MCLLLCAWKYSMRCIGVEGNKQRTQESSSINSAKLFSVDNDFKLQIIPRTVCVFLLDQTLAINYFNQIKGLERSQGRGLEGEIVFVLVKMRDLGQLVARWWYWQQEEAIIKKQDKEKASEREVRGRLLSLLWHWLYQHCLFFLS